MKRILILIVVLLLMMPAFAEQEEPFPAAPVDDLPALGEIGNVTLTKRELTDEEMRQSLPLYGKRIGIDPGHQAHANSAKEAIAPGSSEMKAKVSGGTSGVKTRKPEHEVNLEISLTFREYLESLGAEVYMTRETADVDISNQERAIMMNELGVDLVLRIHCNGSTKKESNGIGLYVRSSGSETENSALLGECMMPCMTAETGAKNAGIHRTNNYTGINWSVPPCVLVELGYLTNPEEDLKLNDPEYQMLLIKGMTQGIIDYYAAKE